MKHITLLFAICTSIILLANLNGAFPENTAAPGELTCGRAPCHNTPVNVGDSQILITFNQGDSVFMADSVYTVRVKIQDPMTLRNGFQLLALDANNQNMGAWQLTEPTKMKIIAGIGLPNRKYVTHLAAGNQQSEWTTKWKAPTGNTGKATFYASVLSANNNGLNTGDEVYSTKIIVDFKAVSAIGRLPLDNIKVYPNLTGPGIWIEWPTAAKTALLTLYNSSGTPLKEQNVLLGGIHYFETTGLPGGVYFLAIETEGKRAVKKVVFWQ